MVLGSDRAANSWHVSSGGRLNRRPLILFFVTRLLAAQNLADCNNFGVIPASPDDLAHFPSEQ